jgi:hypothetical protein
MEEDYKATSVFLELKGWTIMKITTRNTYSVELKMLKLRTHFGVNLWPESYKTSYYQAKFKLKRRFKNT